MSSQFDAAGTAIPTATLVVRGIVATVVALVANGVILGAVLATELVAPIDPLSIGPVALFTILGVAGATLVFGVLTRRSDRPNRTFLLLAAAVLVLSFGPDLWLWQSDPAATMGAVAVLMVMHAVVAASSVVALTDRYSPIAR
ncbi:DUF6069 family protein [Halovivax limisalsi]|uniref:DUF6069 family protein n=1 Tax=Halovivax limisalsi TaxID=1453760 RepID=UPI001FFD3236|nr:DUF6069 family protein [Halovivax limisalsi]